MAKNWIGREDPFLENENVTYAGFPSIEGAVQQLTGVTLPFADLSRGKGALLNNAAVAAEGLVRRMNAEDGFPEPVGALGTQQQPTEDRIRQLRDMYLDKKRLQAGRGKSFYPSQE